MPEYALILVEDIEDMDAMAQGQTPCTQCILFSSPVQNCMLPENLPASATCTHNTVFALSHVLTEQVVKPEEVVKHYKRRSHFDQ